MKKTKSIFDIVCIGGSTTDVLFYSREGELISTSDITKQKLLAFEYGAKIMADKVFFTYGGGAANASVSFSRLGLKSSIITRVGHDDNGKGILLNFKDNHVNDSLIKIDKKLSTGFSVILTVNNESKEHVAFLHRGANEDLSAKDIPSEIDTDWFYITSLPKEGWASIMSKVVKTEKKIAWNPGASQLKELKTLKTFLPFIEVLILNRDEAFEFKKLKDIKGLLKYIYSLGPKMVTITDGAKGAYLFDGKTFYFMKAPRAKAVNTIGVGDSFGSALTAGLVYGKSIRQALSWAVKNSASVVGQVGAQKGLLTLRQISK